VKHPVYTHVHTYVFCKWWTHSHVRTHTQPRTVLLSVIANTENKHQYEKAFS